MLVAAVAALGLAVTLLAPRLGAPSAIVRAVAVAFHDGRTGLSPAAEELVDAAARGGPDQPTPLVAYAAVRAEVGRSRADRLIAAALVRGLLARFPDLQAPRVATPYRYTNDALTGAAPPSYALVPSGPLRLVRVATTADEEAISHAGSRGGLRAAASSLLSGYVIGRATRLGRGVHRVVDEIDAAANIGQTTRGDRFQRAGNAAIGGGIGYLQAPRTVDLVVPPPGRRAGDIVFCQPISILLATATGNAQTPSGSELHVAVGRAGETMIMDVAGSDCADVLR